MCIRDRLGFLWGKNVAFIFIRKSRYTKEFIDNGETFSMTFFDKKYKNDLKYFGAVSGRQEDKFKTSGLNLNYHNDVCLLYTSTLSLLSTFIIEREADFFYNFWKISRIWEIVFKKVHLTISNYFQSHS